MRGVVKAFMGDRGFGFIKPDGGGGDVFFHVRDFEPRDVDPQPRDEVEFDVGQDQRSGRAQAQNVRLV